MYFILHIRRWAFGIGLLAVASGAGWAQTPVNACDLATPYGTIDASDVQAIINMSLGASTCTANIAGAGVCNAAVVQRVVNAALGGACVTGYGAVAHYVTLSWTASTTPNVTYNLYRASGTAPTPCASPTWTTPLITGITVLSVQDSTVTAGASYCYTVTAVSGSSESAYSSPLSPATIPTP